MVVLFDQENIVVVLLFLLFSVFRLLFYESPVLCIVHDNFYVKKRSNTIPFTLTEVIAPRDTKSPSRVSSVVFVLHD